MREKILTILEKNARITARDLAILLGETEEAVSAEIAAMEKEKVIGGYHTLINWDKTGTCLLYTSGSVSADISIPSAALKN